MGSRTRNFANNVNANGRPINVDVAEFDDNKIVNDLSTLGLRVHTQENLNASNTNSQYVDVFNDDSGYTNGADTARNSDEYVSSVAPGVAAFSVDNDTNLLFHFEDTSESKHGANTIVLGPHAELSTTQAKFGSKSLRNYNIDQSYAYVGSGNNFQVGTGALTVECWLYSLGSSDAYSGVVGRWWGGDNVFDLRAESGDASANIALHDGTSIRNTGQALPSNQWVHLAWTRDGSGNNALWYNGVSQTTWTNSNSMSLGTKDLIFGATDSGTGYHYNGYIDEVRLSSVARYSSTFTPNQVFVTNATGNFTCPAITAGSSTTKMGAVITYQDNAGTNALNTDIVLQLSADNGSNFSTATLTALPDFSSGIKCAKVNDLSVTAGTQLKYKISFANQASGSKEARIRGVSLNY